jgi:hypothetical protein
LAILRRIQTGNSCVDAVLFLLVRLLMISGTMLVAGTAGLLRAHVLGIAGILALLGLLACGIHRNLPRLRLPTVRPLLLVFLAVVGLRLMAQVWFFSPHLGDALAYHLPKIGEWIRAGGFIREMGIHPHVTFPAGFELIETWWVVFLHHDVLIEMAGVEFLVLAFAAAWAMARYAGLSPDFAALASTLYVLSPGLHLSATSCLNDTPAAALVVATMALVVWRSPLSISLMAIGLGLGVKATTLYALGGVVLLEFLNRRDPRLACGSPHLTMAVSLVSIAVGMFWYARNLLWFGNPIYPVGSPGYMNEPVAVQVGPRLDSLFGNMLNLVNTRIYDNQAALGANVDLMAGWGATSFACGLLALLLAIRSDYRVRRLFLCFLVSLGFSFLLVIHDPWCMKYVFYFPVILAIGAAWMAQSLQGVQRIVAAALVLDFVFTILPYDLPFKDFKRLAGQSWRERSAIALTQPELSHDPIGCFGGYTANSYHLYCPAFSRRVVYLRTNSGEGLINDMKQHGIKVLYASPVGARDVIVTHEAVRSSRLTHVAGRIYRLGSD